MSKYDYRKISLWKDISEDQWMDWKWQIANRITTIEQLEKVVKLTREEKKGVENSLKKLRMAITPHYAVHMDRNDPACPIRRQAIPTIHETKITRNDCVDPLHEKAVAYRPMFNVLPSLYAKALRRETGQGPAYGKHQESIDLYSQP